MDTKNIIDSINQSMGIQLPALMSVSGLKKKLAMHFNLLADNDFNRLVNLLYRLDIDENKLRGALADCKDMDAGAVIAELVFNRQVEKFKSRDLFRQNENDEKGEEEKW